MHLLILLDYIPTVSTNVGYSLGFVRHPGLKAQVLLTI